MARDSSLAVQEKLIETMKASAALTALVPSERIYPPETPREPTWPFIRYGVDAVIPFGATCMDGCEIVVAIHAFTKTAEETGGGQALAKLIAATIAHVLVGGINDGRVYELDDLDYPAKAHIFWTDTQCVQDAAEAGAWHSFASFRIMVTS